MKCKKILITCIIMMFAACNLWGVSAYADNTNVSDFYVVSDAAELYVSNSKQVLYTDMSVLSNTRKEEIYSFLDDGGIIYIEDSNSSSYEILRLFFGRKNAQIADENIHGYIVEKINGYYDITVRSHVFYNTTRTNVVDKSTIVASITEKAVERYNKLSAINSGAATRATNDAPVLFDYKYSEFVYYDGSVYMGIGSILQEVYHVVLLYNSHTFTYRDVWDVVNTFNLSPVSDRYINWWIVSAEPVSTNSMSYAGIIKSTELQSDVTYTYSLGAVVSGGTDGVLSGGLNFSYSWSYPSGGKSIVNQLGLAEKVWDTDELTNTKAATRVLMPGIRVERSTTALGGTVGAIASLKDCQIRKNMFNKWTFEGKNSSTFYWAGSTID